MVDGFHLHLGYEVAVSIAHQGTNPYIGALFICPYITRVIRHMGLLQGTDCMRIVKRFAAMSLETLRSMGMPQRVHTARGVEYRVQQSTSSTAASEVLPVGEDTPVPPLTDTTLCPRSRSPSRISDYIICSTTTF